MDDRELINVSQSYSSPSDYFSPKERGYGFWQWESMLISYYCNKGCHQLVYIDAGCDVNRFRLLELINWFKNQDRFDLVLSRTSHSISHYAKPSAIEYFQEHLSAVKYDLCELEMLQAAFILLKSNIKTVELFSSVTSLVIHKKDIYLTIQKHHKVIRKVYMWIIDMTNQ